MPVGSDGSGIRADSILDRHRNGGFIGFICVNIYFNVEYGVKQSCECRELTFY